MLLRSRSLFLHVAVCVLQCVAVCCRVKKFVGIMNETKDAIKVSLSLSLCCRVCVAVCCSVLQCVQWFEESWSL